jgi:hypothetical protein
MRKQGKYIYVMLIAVIAMFRYSGLLAQKPFDTIQVNVITRYKPTIHDAVKLDSTPALADTIHITRTVKYDFPNSQYPTSYTPPQIAAMQIKGEPLEPLTHSLLCAGVGNYNTLYGEYFFNSLRSNNMDYGFHLNHLSSVYTTNDINSNYAFNNIDAYGEKFFNQHTLTVDAGFQNHSLNDYGIDYTTLEPLAPLNHNITNSPAERFDYTNGSIDYASQYKDSSRIGNDVKLKYYNFNDIYNATENNVNADMKFFTYFEQQRIDLKARVNYFDDVNQLGNNTDWDVLLNPYFSANETHWDAHLGANVYFNTMDKKANVYPDLLARYHIAQDAVMLYAGIDGNETYNSYKSLSDINPFVQDTMKLHYTYTTYHVYGGITGSITPKLTYNLSVAQSMINDMPLFVTDTLEPLKNRFTVVYDNVKVSNIHGDIDYQWKNNLSVILAGDYNIYTPTNQLKAWYNPALKISATGEYTIQNKYILKAEFFVVGSQYAPQLVDDIMTAKTISGYPDLNLGIDYRHNKSFTFFLNLNNVANVAYYSWDNYEMERFNLLIGVRFGF